MKKLFLFVFIFTTVLYAESNIVPMEKLREIADKNAVSLWGDVHPAEAIPIYSLNDEIIAYTFNYSIGKNFEDTEKINAKCHQIYEDGDKSGRWRLGEYGNILMSARKSTVPIIRYSKTISDEFAFGVDLRILAEEKFGDTQFELVKIYYMTDLIKWYCYKKGSRKIFIKVFPPLKVYSESEFDEEINRSAEPGLWEIPLDKNNEWEDYLGGKTVSTRSDHLVPNEELVPNLDWSYGCSPTACAMGMAYWDHLSLTSANDYGRLVQNHYQRWDPLQSGGEWDYNVADLQRELAIEMNTDSLTGGTAFDSEIRDGMINEAADRGYSFSCVNNYGSEAQYWSWTQDEIDAGRTFHYGTPGHSSTGVGYTDSDFVIRHNTWTAGNDYDHIGNCNLVGTIVPGGQDGCGVEITKPFGDPRYSDNVVGASQGEDLYAGDVFEITWDYDYLASSYTKLYYSTNSGLGPWHTITSNTPNDGVYDWVIPSGLSSTQGRIKVEIWDGSGLAAADGSWGNFTFHSGGSLQVLGSDGKVNTSTAPDYYQFTQGIYSTWGAVGVRNNTAGENWSMKMYTDNSFTTELASSAYTYPVDFVVIDGHHSPIQYRGIKAYRFSGSNTASVEFEGYNESITPGVTKTDTWVGGDVVEMYDVHLSPGTYSFDLTFTSGTADLDVALFGSSGAAYYGNRQYYLARSINLGGGTNESFTFTVTTDDYYGFCVWANDGNTASYEIDIDPMIAGLWTGATNYNWNLGSNWDDGIVPNTATSVVIPSSYTYRPIISWADAYCNNLTVESGAILEIQDYHLYASGNMTIIGNFRMSDNLGNLYVDGDIIWESGSTANITASSAEMLISGNWNFESGANVHLDDGYVEFRGTSNKFIRSYESNCYFNNVKSNKPSAYIGVSNWSTETLQIKGNLYNYSGSSFNGYSDYPIELGGFFNNMGGHFLFDYGTFVYTGGAAGVPLKPNTGDYFNHLKIDTSTQSLSLDATYTTTLQINGDFVLESGYFSPNGFTVEVGGNWTNNAGISNFYESTSRIIFNGSSHQYVLSDETFNILEVDCGAALRVNNVSHTVTCNSYDWTSGGIDILNGTFTALDLEDDGLFGGYWLNPGATINLHQGTTGSEYIDLNGNLTFSGGGIMNIYGGSYRSEWPFDDNASITMSGGTLDIHDEGIKINSSTYTLTEDITGGTIRTAYNFIGDRTDFNPLGGTIELYGSTDADLSMGVGSNFYNILINKTGSDEQTKTKKKNKKIQNRDGSVTELTRAEEVNVASDLDINGNLQIANGTFDLNGNTVDVANDVDVYGTLKMINALDVLNVGDAAYDNLTFKNGSFGNLAAGEVNLASWVSIESGGSITGTTGNTMNFNAPGVAGIQVIDPGSVFGNINVISSNPFYLSYSSTAQIEVDGNFDLQAGNTIDFQNESMIVHGNFTDDPTSTIYVYDGPVDRGNNRKYSADDNTDNHNILMDSRSRGGSFEIDTDFTLTGLMNVGDGDVLLHGDFELASSGTLTIDGGTFICDVSHSRDRSWQNIRGDFNLNDGLFEITNNSLQFISGIHNITGGTIRVGEIFYASNAGVFQPTNGVVEISDGHLGGNIVCQNGNYFHNLIINDDSNLSTDIIINNDLEIIAGTLSVSVNNFDIEIGGNWTNSGGTFSPGTSTVTFDGTGDVSINGNETFYNLTLDKVNSADWLTPNGDLNIGNDLVVNPGALYSGANTISVSGNTTVNYGGVLYMQANSTLALDAASNFSVSNGGWVYVVGSAGNYATVTRQSTGFYDFRINSGGYIGAQYAIFEYMDGSGIFVRQGANVHSSFTFNNCIFRNGHDAPSALLALNSDNVFTSIGTEFYNNTSGLTGYNVYKFYDTGEVTFDGGGGDFWGEAYDYDEFITERVIWSGGVPPVIDDLTIQYNAGPPEEIELNWTYPVTVDHFNIYRSTDPYNFSGPPAFTTPYTPIVVYPMPATGTKYFYYVTADNTADSEVSRKKEISRKIGISADAGE